MLRGLEKITAYFYLTDSISVKPLKTLAKLDIIIVENNDANNDANNDEDELNGIMGHWITMDCSKVFAASSDRRITAGADGKFDSMKLEEAEKASGKTTQQITSFKPTKSNTKQFRIFLFYTI